MGAPKRRRKKAALLPGWLSRTLIVSCWATGILSGVLLVVAGGIYFRLSQGPISFESLTRTIERGISEDLGGLTANIDDALIVLGDNGLEFRLKNLELKEPDGDLVASAPLASASVSMAGLMKLRVVPTRVFLIEPQVFAFYSDEGGLALSFSSKKETAAGKGVVPPVPVPAQRPAAIPKASPTTAPSERIDLAQKLIEATAQARRGMKASSELREIGLKDATVTLVFAGQSSEWKVPEFVVDLAYSKRDNVISGSGQIDSGQGIWSFGFKTEDSMRSNEVKLHLSVQDFVPSSLAAAVPRFSLLKMLDMRVAGEGSLVLASNGRVTDAKLDLEFGEGNVLLPQVSNPLKIDSGSVGLSYDGPSRRLTVQPSTFKWGKSAVTLVGNAVQSGDAASGNTVWEFDLNAKDGVLAAEDLGVASVKLEGFKAAGRIDPKNGVFELKDARLKVGGGELSAAGDVRTGNIGSSTRLEGKVANLPLDTVKTLWPRPFAPAARAWIGRNLAGRVKTGTLTVLSGDYAEQGQPGPRERITYALEASDLKAQAVEGVGPIVAPRALIRGEGGNLEINVPEAALAAASKGALEVRNAKLIATDLGSTVPQGELSFKAVAPVAAAIELAQQMPNGPLAGVELPVDNASGKIDGQFTVKLPLVDTVQKHDVKVVGKARVSDIKVKPKTGRVEVQSGTVTADLTETKAEAKGELIVNGVLAKVQWEHVLDVPGGMQSPIEITARLDNSDRTQLGLDVNHMVQGDVPIKVTVTRGDEGANVHLKADLTAAELIVEEVAWRKPANRNCALELEVGKTRPDGRVELQNFKIAGDDVAIEGSAILDPDNEMREFAFPRFSLGLVSRIELSGKQNPKDKIWKINAKGPTFDGRSFFDSLFSLGRVGDSAIKPLRPANGADVEAEIGTVLGYGDNSLKGLKFSMSTRKDKMTALDAGGKLESGKSFRVIVENKGARRLFAESDDAGRMFKAVGFYPNAQNGHLRVEVDLDGSGPAEKTGELVVENFQILGEPVFSELASTEAEKQGKSKQNVAREVTDFDRMRVPFSVGHGQFVLSESYLRGPVMGISLFGKIDYKAGRVNLEGTYIPLQGVNALVCGFPILGQIAAGMNCEGVFGLKFFVTGSNKTPEVSVNPFSLVTPGIFRDIFQMSPSNPKVQPRADEKPAAPAQKRTRASSSGAASGGETGKQKKSPPVDGWSSTESTEPNKQKR